MMPLCDRNITPEGEFSEAVVDEMLDDDYGPDNSDDDEWDDSMEDEG